MITSSDVEKKIPQRKLKTIYTCFDPLGKRGLKKTLRKIKTRRGRILFILFTGIKKRSRNKNRGDFFFPIDESKEDDKKNFGAAYYWPAKKKSSTIP